jgi:hypothetical protein
MKITLDISDDQIRSFKALASLTGQPWHSLLEAEINGMEFFPQTPMELAYEAMRHCKTEEHAKATLERAVAITGENLRERLWITYEQEAGTIDKDEADLRLVAEIILDRPELYC